MGDPQRTDVTIPDDYQTPAIILSCPASVTAGNPMSCTMLVTDADLPPQSLTCSLAGDHTCGGALTGCTSYLQQSATTSCRVSVTVFDGSLNGNDWANVIVNPPSVDLLGFAAERTAAGVLLTWQTGTESACGAFTILRCDLGLGGCAAAADRAEVPGSSVPCEGSPSGASCDALDATAAPGAGYSYLLREHGTDDAVRDCGPVLVAPEATDDTATTTPPGPGQGAPATDTVDQAAGCAVGTGGGGAVPLILAAWLCARRRRGARR